MHVSTIKYEIDETCFSVGYIFAKTHHEVQASIGQISYKPNDSQGNIDKPYSTTNVEPLSHQV